MAPDAFDDPYEGCVTEMEKKAPKLLQEDFNLNKDFKIKWKKAEKQWKQIKKSLSNPEGFHDFHGTALVAYTRNIHAKFNDALRNFKNNPGNFHYKAFHYYLTRALQLLSTQGCHVVYRGSNIRCHYTGQGSVRFGSFASSSLNESVGRSPQFFNEQGTLFTIKTCLGVYIKKFSSVPDEEEVSIPGYEVYHKVTTQNVEEFIKISLDSPQRKKSNFNCFYNCSAHMDNIHFNN